LTTLSNYELQHAIDETVRASVIASFEVRITLDQHLQRLTAIQLERVRDVPPPIEAQEPSFEFSRGQCLQSDVINAQKLLRQCGFSIVKITADQWHVV